MRCCKIPIGNNNSINYFPIIFFDEGLASKALFFLDKRKKGATKALSWNFLGTLDY
jgi:hypothetical protein